MSAAGPTSSVLPAACSGAMKLGVPSTWPVISQMAEPVHALGEAEVGHLGMAFPVEKNVAGLQIAVNDAVRVGVGHGLRHLPDQFRSLPGRQRTVLDLIGQAATFHIAHREIVLARSARPLRRWARCPSGRAGRPPRPLAGTGGSPRAMPGPPPEWSSGPPCA